MRAGSADPSLPRVVTALGIAQLVSWGTLFYTIAVLGPPMRDELRIGDLMLFAFFRRLQPVAVGTLAFAVLALALLLFTQVGGVLALALAFAIPYGWSNGVMTIVRGTVPAVLFGPRGYGALLGRLAQPQFIARASAPMAVALLLLPEGGRAVTPWVLAGGSAVALLAYRRALAAARAAGAPSA